MAVEMKYGDYVKGGWELVKPNLVPSIVAVICAGIPVVGMQVIINYMKGIKEAKESGKSIEIGALFSFDNFVNNLVALLISGVFAMCCGIPFALVYFVAPILADHPGVGFMDAVKGALAFGKQNFVACLLLMIVLGFVGGIGSVACGVGALITYPVMFAAQWLAYSDHKAAIHAAAAESGITLA